MADLASQVISGAQQTAQNQGHTVGDALQAYHIASTAENARQELEMEKQNNDMNRANFIVKSFANISQLPPVTQKLALQSLAKSVPQMIPGANPEVMQMFQQDQDTRQHAFVAAAHIMSQGGISDPVQAKNWLDAFGGDAATAATKAQELGQQIASIKAGQVKAQAFAAPKQEAVDLSTHSKAVDSIAKDKTTTDLLTTMNNLVNAKQNFLKGGASPQEFNELQQAARSNIGVKGSGGVGEREETYLKSAGIDVAKAKQFLFGDPESVMKADPAFAKQILGLVDLEVANKQKVGLAQVDRNAQKYQSFYNRPSMVAHKDDLNNTVQSVKQQFLSPGGVPTDGGSSQPSGGGGSSFLSPTDWLKQNGGK